MHPGCRIEQVYLCRDPVDFRKSIGGLSVLVEQELGLDPFGSALYVFVNRDRNKIKVLYWHRNGFCLWLKRLEAEKFAWPREAEAATRELDGIVTGYRSERRQIGEKYRRQTWADWLQAKAADGNAEALAALRARPGSLTPQRDTLAGAALGAGNDMPHPRFAGQDGVTKKATVIYRLGATTVRDDGKVEGARSLN
jgi:transposase